MITTHDQKLIERTKIISYCKTLLYYNILVDTLCWSIILPTLPGLHDSIFHMNNVTIGAVTSLLSLLMFICGALQGKASDYCGRIQMLRISAISQLLGHLLISISMQHTSVYLFILARCIPSLFKCGMVVSQAYLYDISNTLEISKDIGSLLAYSNVGFIVGPFIGGYAYNCNIYLPFGFGLALALLNLYILHQLDNYSNYANTLANKINDCTALPNENKNGVKSKSNDDQSSISSPPIAAGVGVDISFLQYLHIKFSFQMSNSLFESLFTQHARSQLGLRGSNIGLLLSYSGALSALTNRYLLRFILSMSSYSSYSLFKHKNDSQGRSTTATIKGEEEEQQGHIANPENFLWCFVIGMGIGLYTWALGNNIYWLIFSVTILTISAQLFLSIIQSIIALAQKQKQEESSNKLLNKTNEKIITAVSYAEKQRNTEEDMKRNWSSSQALCELLSRYETHDTTSTSTSSVNTTISSSKIIIAGSDDCDSKNSSHTSNSTSIGALFGMSSAADRGARIISPILGGYFLEKYGNFGLIYLSAATLSYCLSLLIFALPKRTRVDTDLPQLVTVSSSDSSNTHSQVSINIINSNTKNKKHFTQKEKVI